MDGCLVAAIGQKVFIHDLAENDLRATGFVDTQIYTHCSYSFKHFCVIGDIQQGISLLRFQVKLKPPLNFKYVKSKASS